MPAKAPATRNNNPISFEKKTIERNILMKNKWLVNNKNLMFWISHFFKQKMIDESNVSKKNFSHLFSLYSLYSLCNLVKLQQMVLQLDSPQQLNHDMPLLNFNMNLVFPIGKKKKNQKLTLTHLFFFFFSLLGSCRPSLGLLDLLQVPRHGKSFTPINIFHIPKPI